MTKHNLIKISIDQLRIGMYIGSVFSENGTLLFSSNTLMQRYDQIEALRRQGVTTITVNLEKGGGSELITETVSSPVIEKEPVVEEKDCDELYSAKELRDAQVLRKDAADAVRDIVNAAKSGRMFSIQSITDSVHKIISSMHEDPELMLNLCRLQKHSPDLYTHSVNVAVLMAGFARALNYSKEKILAAGIGGMLHDIGFVALPQDLFQKAGSCSRQEMELFKKHPHEGLSVISNQAKSYPEGVLEVIAQHHERSNGFGYPHQITDERISDLAKVCAIADTYDMLTTHGLGGKIFQPQEALALIFQGAEEEYPRTLVEHFTKLLGIYPVGSFVKLTTEEMGVVVRNNRKNLLLPKVRVLFNRTGERIVTPYIKDLSEDDRRVDDVMCRILHSLDPASHGIEAAQFIIRSS